METVMRVAQSTSTARMRMALALALPLLLPLSRSERESELADLPISPYQVLQLCRRGQISVAAGRGSDCGSGIVYTWFVDLLCELHSADVRNLSRS